MATSNAELAFNQEICARVQELRVAKGWKQEQMAVALGVPVERYRKYERRSPLPSYLMERFASSRIVAWSICLRGSLPLNRLKTAKNYALNYPDILSLT